MHVKLHRDVPSTDIVISSNSRTRWVTSTIEVTTRDYQVLTPLTEYGVQYLGKTKATAQQMLV